MEMADDGGDAGFGASGETIAVQGKNAGGSPFADGGEGGEVGGKGAVVVAQDADEIGAIGEALKRLLDGGAFVGGGAGGVDDVAEKHDTTGAERIDELPNLLLSAAFDNGAEVATAALGPGVTEMEVGEDQGGAVVEPEAAGGVKPHGGDPIRRRLGRPSHRKPGGGRRPGGYRD